MKDSQSSNYVSKLSMTIRRYRMNYVIGRYKLHNSIVHPMLAFYVLVYDFIPYTQYICLLYAPCSTQCYTHRYFKHKQLHTQSGEQSKF